MHTQNTHNTHIGTTITTAPPPPENPHQSPTEPLHCRLPASQAAAASAPPVSCRLWQRRSVAEYNHRVGTDIRHRFPRLQTHRSHCRAFIPLPDLRGQATPAVQGKFAAKMLPRVMMSGCLCVISVVLGLGLLLVILELTVFKMYSRTSLSFFTFSNFHYMFSPALLSIMYTLLRFSHRII
ncbi:concanavalin A-like lectin protein kinase family protein [Striga asiatica]|uniref:Concanavalin A-like lectin protein kinase family protein n=1 Tax=Striga asiatica TaxID=4170 RepID=A0A5A7PBD8_STRAF|nr:concanavalin A-like lectin protein kinase family protein [Striga asiatica]